MLRPARFQAQHLVQAFTQGSSRPLLVGTEAGRFVLKLIHGPEGPRSLAAEWITTGIARAIGLPTLELAAVNVTAALATGIEEAELREQIERGSGLALGSRELPGAVPARLRELELADDEFAIRTLWLDILVQNADRTLQNPNILRFGQALFPIDHAAALPFHHTWQLNEDTSALELWPPVGHVFADRAPRLALWQRRLLAALPRETLNEVLATLPSEWLGPVVFGSEERQRAAYVAYLWRRLKALDAMLQSGPAAQP